MTGSSSGIGLATTIRLARRGFHVVGTVRSNDKRAMVIDAASREGVHIEIRLLDLLDRQRRQAVIDEVQPWAIVNNAGYMNAGLLEDVDVDSVRRQFEVMTIAPIHLAQLALPYMLQSGGGRVVNISSVAGNATGAMIGWYQAVKHALSAVSDAARAELSTAGVHVVLIEPGGFASAIWGKAERDLERRQEQTRLPKAYCRSLHILRTGRPHVARPNTVASVVERSLMATHPRARYMVGWDAPVLEAVDLVTPRRIKDALLRRALDL